VTVADIIAAVDEPLDATMCGGKENCHETGRVGGGLTEGTPKGQCMTHDLWATLNKKMHEYLASVTLGHLVRQQRDREAAAQAAGAPAVQSVMVDRRKPGGVRGTPAIA
jgi:Rrf2 family iron-sulfur cluster assembly transcriptional regulator